MLLVVKLILCMNIKVVIAIRIMGCFWKQL